MTFTNRTDAGDQLAAALVEHTYPDPVVLALPRGGVPVSAPIAAALRAPLGPGDGAQDRRLRHDGGYCGGSRQRRRSAHRGESGGARGNGVDPGSGARNSLGGSCSRSSAARAGTSPAGHRADLQGRTAIVVDDGIATGATMRVALQCGERAVALLALVLAVPVAPPTPLASPAGCGGRRGVLAGTRHFCAVGEFYRDFHQVSRRRSQGRAGQGRSDGPLTGEFS